MPLVIYYISGRGKILHSDEVLFSLPDIPIGGGGPKERVTSKFLVNLLPTKELMFIYTLLCTKQITNENPLDSTGEGNGNPLQYSCLENSMDGGASQATVHGVTKTRTRLSDFPFTL